MVEQLRIGVAGLGTVGASVVRICAEHAGELAERCGRQLQVTAVCARDRDRDRGIDISAITWFDDPVEMVNSGAIDVLVEAIGGDAGPAAEAVRAALDAGVSVVTANKALLAAHGNELAERAGTSGAVLNYEAAVGGGIPIIKTMREALAGNRISRVYGILNGTCNYMLTRMEREGLSYKECLTDAQAAGYAEADPTFDVEGHDTAHKLAILTSLAFGTKIDADAVFIEGISSIEAADIRAAAELGYRIKLLGVAQKTDTGIEQRVHPTLVPRDSDIAGIHHVTNAIVVDGDRVGSVMLSGPGAGGDATASAMIADIADIARGIRLPVLGKNVHDLVPYERARMRAHEGGYYIRLEVADQAGVFADIATRMAEQGISLGSIVQKEVEHDEASSSAQIILVTHETTEAAIRAAIDGIRTDGHLLEAPRTIRIEK